MIKKVSQWIGGVLLSSIAVLTYLLLYNTYLFSPLALNIVNTYVLEEYNISAQGNITGSLLGNSTGIQELCILVNNGTDTLLTAKEITLSDWESDLSQSEFLINSLLISEYSFNSQYLATVNIPENTSSSRSSIIIQQVKANDGSLVLEISDSTVVFELDNLMADLWVIDGFTGLTVKTLDVYTPIYGIDSLSLSGLLGIDAEGEKHFDDLHIYYKDADINLNGGINVDGIHSSLTGRGLKVSSFDNLTLPAHLKDLQIDYDLTVITTASGFDISGKGSLSLNNTQYPFILSKLNKDANGQSINLVVGSEFNNIQVSAFMNPDGMVTGNADVFRFDVQPFLPPSKLLVRDPIGTLTFEGSHKEYSINSRFQSFMLNNIQFDSLITDLNISQSDQYSISNARIYQDSNTFNISGELSEQALQLKGYVGISNFDFMRQINNQHILQGQLQGEFNINGTIKEPNISGELAQVNLGYAERIRLNGLTKYDFTFIDGLPIGSIALQGTEGLLFGDSLSAYKLLAYISGDQFEIEDLHFQGKNNLISLDGSFGKQSLDINKFNVIIDENQFKLVDTVNIVRSAKGKYEIPTSVMAFNNAGISVQGSYEPGSGLQLQAQYELLNLENITDFFNIKTPFEGMASGSAKLSGPLNDPEIHAKLTLQDGFTLGYPSDSAAVDITLRSNAIVSNHINAHTNGGELTLTGQLPWGYKMRGDQYKYASQNFSIFFDNYRLKDAKFVKIVGMPVSARASGSLSIRGTPIKTKLDGQISFRDARFDTLSFESGYTDFTYEENLWTFDSLSAQGEWGNGFGTGSMPVSLDMVSDDRTAVMDRDMGLNFNFNLTQMPFLTSYISSIDAIDGEFTGNLSFSGPLSAPIRNGQVSGRNARLEISVLGNPITEINSEISLVDNTMTIDEFSGQMLFAENSALNAQGVVGRATSLITDLIGVDATTDYAGLVMARGTIDFTSFFEPRFDVELKADEVYYRSTDGLIEAIADANLQFVGQDTLDVTAVIPVTRAVYYSNFTSEETYQQTISQVEGTIFRYNLETQYASDLLISNDQMEAEFEGELWLLDYGDGVMRFTGTLNAIEGGKFFYVGNELTIVSGEIIFNSVDFNPQISIETEYEIGSELVKLDLAGDLNEPELVIDVTGTELTQADVLTYLTINQKLVEVSFDTQSALNPVQSYSEMLVEKQLSKIGREITGLDILDVGINLGDADSSETARFQVGQRLSKNLKVTYEGALQPRDGQSDYEYGLEYRINRNVSINSKINQDNEVELNWRLKFSY